jgi:hypothetical protein
LNVHRDSANYVAYVRLEWLTVSFIYIITISDVHSYIQS